MNRALRAYCTVGVGLALALSACASNQWGAPCPIPDKATDEQKQAAINACVPGILEDNFDARARQEVDILFAIDNSTSMAPKQKALADNISAFISQIATYDADLHIGVVTSDVGSYTAEGASWSTPIQGCNSFKGDDGELQVKGCGQRLSGISSDAQNACISVDSMTGQPFCPDQFRNSTSVTTDGAHYISKINGKTNVIGDDITNAFKCMAFVGDGGCGIEGQLEGVRRALDGHLPDNAGFLSQDALLAVIFITDEDDCSVQLAQRKMNNPNTRDCSTADQNAAYDCFNPDYRCLATSVKCDEPMNVTGDKHNCVERPGNYLESVQGYHDNLVSVAGGDNKLLISGIWSVNSTPPNDPPNLPLNLQTGAQLNVSYETGGTVSGKLNRSGGSLASCYNSTTGIFGQAERRLSAFASSFGKNKNNSAAAPEFSICDLGGDPNKVQIELKAIADAIGMKLPPFCLPQQPKVLSTGPNCLVGDVDADSPTSLPDTFFPQCSAACCNGWATSTNPTPADQTVKTACASETKDCYCAVASTVGACNNVAGWVGGVSRAGNANPPAGKRISFRCAKGP